MSGLFLWLRLQKQLDDVQHRNVVVRPMSRSRTIRTTVTSKKGYKQRMLSPYEMKPCEFLLRDNSLRNPDRQPLILRLFKYVKLISFLDITSELIVFFKAF